MWLAMLCLSDGGVPSRGRYRRWGCGGVSRWRNRSGVDDLMKSLWRVNVGYVFGEMKRLKGCDRWNWGSISLKLAQVPVYLQDEWGPWRLRDTLTGFDHFD